jgi:putative peptidoglycan lipid II flippase
VSHRAPVPAGGAASRSLLSASVVMAVGTILSRLTGFVRAALVIAAIGTAVDADLFTQANTIPNSLYILVAGGVLNVVLVPQLVRSMRNDADGGQAYASRVFSLAVVVLGIATIALVLAVPLVARVAFDAELFTADLAEQRASAYDLMRYCMPQVFFYGVFVLLGQMLNARERFGPMMWAPIVNNVVACAVLGLYIGLHGTSHGSDGFTADQELLLGVGSTVGVLVQTLVLVPYLRAAGIRLRLRFDFRGSGLGHTLRLGAWTLGFVLLNQVAFFAVSRIATGSSVDAAVEGGQAAGVTVYQNAFLVTQVPHAIITVSLVTATMPLLSRLAADGDRAGMRREIISTLRLVLTAIVPFAAVLACLGGPVAGILFGYGEGDGAEVIGTTISAFAPGLVLFTVHYLLLRGFYADEDTRTPFLVQIGLAATNIGAAVAYTHGAPPHRIAMLLALAYATAYLVGSLTSSVVLSRRIGTLFGAAMLLFLLRLAVATGAAAVAMLGVSELLQRQGPPVEGPLPSLVLTVTAGLAGALVYVLAAWAVRLREVGSLLQAVSGRLR